MYISEDLAPDRSSTKLANSYIKRSELLKAIKDGVNVSKIQDPDTLQFKYGNLLCIPEDLPLRLARNIQGFKDQLGIELNDQDLDGILLFILKTDQDLFNLVEETVFEIIENERPLWLSPHDRLIPPEEINKNVVGTIRSIVGLPAVGKSWVSQQYAHSSIVLDNDQFRFNVLGHLIYNIDNTLFDEDSWRKSQHLYGPEIYKIYHLCYRACARWLKLQGLDVITTSLATRDETDEFVLLNPNELKAIIEEPRPDNFEKLLHGDIGENLKTAGYSAFAALFKKVKSRVEQRAKKSGQTGSVNVHTPVYEPIPVRQTHGANPKLDDVSIARIIDWVRSDIIELRETDIPLTEVEVSNLRENATLLRSFKESPTKQSFGSHNLIVPTGTLIGERANALDKHEAIMEKILVLGNKKLSSENLREEILELVKKLLKKRATELDLRMQEALAYVLVRELFLKNGELVWPTRDEVIGGLFPRIRKIPHPLHSTVGIPSLGNTLNGKFTYLDWLVAMSHDQFEVASDHRIGREIGGSTLLRTKWNQDVERIWLDRPYSAESMAVSACLLTERVSRNQQKRIRAHAEPLYTHPNSLASKYLEAVRDHGFTGDELQRTGRIGPTSYTYLGLKYEGIVEVQNHGRTELARSLLNVALLDRFEDTLSLARYFAYKFPPPLLRFKLLSYTGRLLSSLNKLREVFVQMEDDTRKDLADAFRTFTPLMFDIIEQEINPGLEVLGQYPIERDEVFEFYWSKRVPLVSELEEQLRPIAAEHVREALRLLK